MATEIKRRLNDPSDLPDGSTCADCVHFKRCEWLISANAEDARCDWEPSRFRPRTTHPLHKKEKHGP
jgi:hypothetical protein